MRKQAMPFRPETIRCGKARDRHGARQARLGAAGRLLALAAPLALGACVGSPGESPWEFYRQISGEALEGRPLPPGMSEPSPNLASVPQRPSRGPASARAELTSALEANRAAAANPGVPGTPLPERPATEGLASVPAAPPAPPRLAAAPPIGQGPATLLVPGMEPPQIEESAPEPPPAELSAPPPPDLAAPPSFPPIAPRGL
ncbi:hypothetical protein [Roseomonas xinghualingensis]|uniref:hypothetical protein n=1 Tax=Roseomonas xinghualingensis TaxID=2986475 RepID=UPI0021F11D90|nr:hypothetical protein [Roseomonas sp. SXEYE001]MCV4209234.1 hypothetical protein [Roseomonas sp. SXEYE001]